jgi:hypothetical protein
MESKRNLTGEGGDQNSNGIQPPSKSPSYMDELSSVPTSQPHPPSSQSVRYGPPPTKTNNTAYNQRTNNYHEEPQRPISGQQQQQQQNHHLVASPQHHQQINHPVANNSSPYSARGAPNVVYSSDGSAGTLKYRISHRKNIPLSLQFINTQLASHQYFQLMRMLHGKLAPLRTTTQ